MRVESEVPFSLDDIDAAWLTRAFRDGGVISTEEIVDFDSRIIGEETGFLGQVVIITPTYSCETDAPKSMVLKIPTPLKNRRMGQSMGAYEKEIRFYSDLKPTMNIRSPGHYYSAMNAFDDPEDVLGRLRAIQKLPMLMVAILSLAVMWVVGLFPRRYVLLIEDVSYLRLGDQVGGCSDADIEKVMTMMAKLHAQYWETEELESLKWIQPADLTSKITHMMFLQTIGKYIAANEETLTDHQRGMLEWLKENGLALNELIGGAPRTLLHGDFRLDNVCFDDKAGEAVLMDWQTMLTGSCGFDLAYFLSASLEEDTSQEKIDRLLEFYRSRLAEEGVDVSFEWLKWQYEASMVLVLHRISSAAHQEELDLGVERGPELMQSWVSRILSKVEAVDFENILTPPQGAIQ